MYKVYLGSLCGLQRSKISVLGEVREGKGNGALCFSFSCWSEGFQMTILECCLVSQAQSLTSGLEKYLTVKFKCV